MEKFGLFVKTEPVRVEEFFNEEEFRRMWVEFEIN